MTFAPKTDPASAQVFENNRRWVEERTAQDPRFFEKLARDQDP